MEEKHAIEVKDLVISYQNLKKNFYQENSASSETSET